MSKFKLTPVEDKLNHPSWRYSTEKSAVYVAAADEGEARQRATSEFIIGAMAVPGQTLVDARPWMNRELVTCKEVAEIGRTVMPDGMICPVEEREV